MRLPEHQGARRLALLAALAVLMVGGSARALDPARRLSQYAHNAWTMQDGYLTGTPNAIGQTTDGYLWIGTAAGLIRFDGVRFVPWAPQGEPIYQTFSVTALMGDRDGGLWVAAERSRGHPLLTRWTGHELVNYPLNSLIPSWSILETRSGTVWISRPFCQVLGTGLRCPTASNPPTVLRWGDGLAEDADGALWLGGSTGALRWTPSHVESYTPTGLQRHAGQSGVRAVAAGADGSVWLGMGARGPGMGLQHVFRGRSSPVKTPTMDSSTWLVSSLLLDHHGALWVGTWDSGLYRLFEDRIENFRSVSGLSSDSVNRVYEDFEGNIWVATAQGIDRFRDTSVISYSRHEGLCTPEVDSVLAAHDGTLWVGGYQALTALRGDQFLCIEAGKGLPGDQVTSLLEDHEHQLWVGIDNTMTVYDQRRFTEIKKSDGARVGLIVAITEDINHDKWLVSGDPHRALLRIRGNQAEEVPLPGIPEPHAVAPDPQGGIWLGLMNGDLARYRDGRTELVHFERAVDSVVNQVSVDSDGSVLAATGAGLLGLRNGIRRTLNTRNGLPCDGVSAFIRDASGSVWLFLRCGYVEIASSEMRRWWENPQVTFRLSVLDALDGMQAGTAPFNGSARTPDGRLWFANRSTLQMIDPRFLRKSGWVPLVHVEEVIADRRHYRPGAVIALPALTRNIEIDYTAPSFATPQRVQFRYRLEGHDVAWQDAGGRRQAFYTDLPPGSYRFDLITSNSSGDPASDSIAARTTDRASTEFTIAPAYYQTRWFYALCAMACIALFTLLYRMRVRQVAVQVRGRLEARLAERERIARELHDTLLQGMQGLIWRFQAASDRIPPDEPARQLMEQSLDRADRLLEESRDKVKDLRPVAGEAVDLAQALAAEGEQFAQLHPAEFRVSIQGPSRDLHPIVREESILIGREALGNAFRHSGAKDIEAELTYGEAVFHLRVRDDGRGISESVLDAGGKPGHFGLVGMRERAKKLGGSLEVWSKPHAGTEIDFRVPGHIAYAESPVASAGLGWLLSIVRSTTTQK